MNARITDISDKVKVILNEKEGLRQEQCDVQRLMHRTILAFLLAFVTVLATYFSEGLVRENYKAILFLSLSQVQVLLFLLFCSLLSIAHVRAAYIAALEHRLNQLAGENLNVWESEICPKYVMGATSPCFITYAVQGIGYLLIFITLIYLSYDVTEHILWGVGLTIEVLVVLGLYLWSFAKRKEIETLAKKKLGVKRENPE